MALFQRSRLSGPVSSFSFPFLPLPPSASGGIQLCGLVGCAEWRKRPFTPSFRINSSNLKMISDWGGGRDSSFIHAYYPTYDYRFISTVTTMRKIPRKKS